MVRGLPVGAGLWKGVILFLAASTGVFFGFPRVGSKFGRVARASVGTDRGVAYLVRHFGFAL